MRKRLIATPIWVVIVALTAGYAVVCWSGVERWHGRSGEDEYSYRDYVNWLDKQHRIPRRDQNYEYALPIGVPAVGLVVQRAFGTPNYDKPTSPPLQVLPNMLRRLLWLALVVGGAFALSRSVWAKLFGAGLLIAAGGWAAAYIVAATDNEGWLPLVLIAYVTSVALVPASAWVAREAFPRARAAPVLGAVGAMLLPPILAATLYFHPDPPFALLASVAVALTLRALRRGLTIPAGIALGVALGLAAWTRQSAPLVAVSLGLAVALAARRSSWRYLVAAGATMVVVVSPWWYQQTLRYDNPIKSNLNRPGYMLDHQPLSFYVSLPVALVTDPHSPHFRDALLPRFHAYIWSDWYGGYHEWKNPKRFASFLSSAQSVLGFGGDALVLGALAFLGFPAIVRSLRRRAEPRDGPLVVLTSLFVLSWLAFAGTLIRFPQRDGDPIKVRYLLFLAPVCVALAIAGGRALVLHGGRRRALFLAWLATYAVSWVLTIATAF
jgi:4-amino-4-deoxy-L-arabinose transferase-like glycosyltransferase